MVIGVSKQSTGHGTPKNRLSVPQLVLGAVLMAMVVLIFYMHKTIDALHREQEVMRLQLAELAVGDSKSFLSPTLKEEGGSHNVSPLNSDLLLPKKRTGEFLPPQKKATRGSVRKPPAASPPGFIKFDEGRKSRRLQETYTVGTTANVGCFQIANQAAISYDVSSITACNGNSCPICFAFPAVVGQATTLTINNCGSAVWYVRGGTTVPRSGVYKYSFINTHASQTLTVTDNSASPTSFKVPPMSHIQAFCGATIASPAYPGVTNKLMFPSIDLPTLIVDSGLTLSAGNFDASNSGGTFRTTTGVVTLGGTGGTVNVNTGATFSTGTGGAVTLNGNVAVSGTYSLTVGSAGSSGASTFYGAVTMGTTSAGQGVTLTVNGPVVQGDVGGTGSVFTSGSGQFNVNGNLYMASNANLVMQGASQFTSGTGTNTFNGNVVITSSNTFTSGTGTVSLRGSTQIAVASGSTALTVGTAAGNGGASILYGTLQVGGTSAGQAAASTFNGNVAIQDVSVATSTFTTGTGAVTLNGDTTISAGKNFNMWITGASSLLSFSASASTITLSAPVTISGGNTFTSGTGQVSLLGNTYIDSGRVFQVGAATAAGITGSVNLYPPTIVGAGAISGLSSSLTVTGNVAFQNDANGNAATFSTGTGTITFNGDVTMGAGRSFTMNAATGGTFTTGTGAVTLNGPTTVANPQTFKIAAYTNNIVCTYDALQTGSYCRAA